jgi:hypothetical protein
LAHAHACLTTPCFVPIQEIQDPARNNLVQASSVNAPKEHFEQLCETLAYFFGPSALSQTKIWRQQAIQLDDAEMSL